MRRRHLSIGLAFLSALVCSAFLLAQAAVGVVAGVTTDTTGAVMPGVIVTLSAPTLAGGQRSTTTNERGAFRFGDVPSGIYQVTAELPGFQTISRPLSVSAGQTHTVTFTLAVAAGTELMVVTGSAPLVGVQNLMRPEMLPALPLGRPEAGNTEAYDKIDEHEWTTVREKPLSTFSADVDTASYANVRRFLNGHRLPPKDAVRIEEMLNYFSYDYPEPTGAAPLAVTTSVAECPWDPRHRLALVGLQAKRLSAENIPPRNLVFLIDVSGSMQMPTKLPLVKAALTLLARNLTARDRVAIVVYAGAAGLVLPSTPGSDTTSIVHAIGQLEAGGSTNGAQGLRLAYQTARAQFITGGANRVVLATDGDFNIGVTNQGDLIRLIEDQRDSGIVLSVLGFGMGNLKDSTMEKLADRGNGNYAYIDTLAEARKVLVHEAAATLVMVAKDVKLQVEFNPRHVKAYRLVGYENRLLQNRDFNDDRKDAGDLGAGHSVTALYEIVPAGQPVDTPAIDPLRYQQPIKPAHNVGRDELMTVKIRYKPADGDTSSLMSTPVFATGSVMTDNLGFAAAVSEFGMLLRDSKFKGVASYAQAFALAKKYTSNDPFGHRAELVRLIGLAEEIGGQPR